MRFEFFISRRYLASRERRGLISLITLISIGGVAVGVAALIVVIAVMEGFDKELMDRMMGSWSHVTIMPAPHETIRDYEQVIALVEKDPAVIAASPLIARDLLFMTSFSADAEKVPARIMGFDFRREGRVTNFMKDVKVGSATPGANEVVLGLVLAQSLRTPDGRPLMLGDDIYALTTFGRFAGGPVPKRERLKLVGVFQSGLYEVDARFGYTSLPEAQSMYLLDEGGQDVIDQIHVRVQDPYALGPVKERLQQALLGQGRLLNVRGWDELNPDFFSALQLEKIVMFIILLLIVLVAAFNIIGTLIMIVIEKTREIGILRAMGATHRQILRIFLSQGFIVGLLGILLGVGIGFFICWSLATWVPIQLPAGVYGIYRLPVLIRWETVAIIVISALAICVGASFLPAWRAARLQPTQALRYE